MINFPYSNLHQLDLDWVISRLKAFEAWVQGQATEDIKAFIEREFENIMIDAVYKEETKSLVLSIKYEERDNG